MKNITNHMPDTTLAFIISSKSDIIIQSMLRMALVLATSIVLALFSVSQAYAGDRRPPKGGVTPYGDFCNQCSTYGKCKNPVGQQKAVSAINSYFHTRGFSIANISGMGRFMTADVYKNGRLVDRVIFDRRSGRIRSIY